MLIDKKCIWCYYGSVLYSVVGVNQRSWVYYSYYFGKDCFKLDTCQIQFSSAFFQCHFCYTNKFFTEPSHPWWEFDDKGPLDLTFINIADNIRILSSIFPCKVESILCHFKLQSLIWDNLFWLPLRATNLRRPAKNCAAVISSISSRCIALTVIQVKIHTHALRRTVPFFTYNCPT